MSLEGKATSSTLLRGTINKINVIYTDAYALAVANGFDGTIEEWLASMNALHSVQTKVVDGVLVMVQKED